MGPQREKIFYETTGRRIREARLNRKPPLTQEALAKLVGLTRTSITNLEQGWQKCLLHTFADIASALQVEPASLLPPSDPYPVDLDRALKNRAPAEKQWILSAVTAATSQKEHNGA